MPPAPDERHILASQHAKFPRFPSIQTYIHDTYRAASRTTRLTTLTAAAAIAAVAAGVSAAPAYAASGDLASHNGGTVMAASHTSAVSLDAAATVVPIGQVAAPATSRPPVAPLAQSAVRGPSAPLGQSAPTGLLAPTGLSAPIGQPASPAPHQLPAQTPKQPIVRASLATNANGTSAPGSKPGQQSTPANHPAVVIHAAASPKPAVQHAVAPPGPYQIYDSVTPGAIPPGQVVATYATGPYAVPLSQVTGRRVVWIDTQGTDPAASALDVEPGDATPASAAAWAARRLSATPGAVARIYTMISEWPAVRAAISTLPQRMQAHVRYWIADPTGVPHLLPGSDATQWYWGKSFDISNATGHF